ncbi:hypothetical protein A4A49_57055, partial [Nicotiana attenuata]
MNKMMVGCNRMMLLEHICVFFFILSMAPVYCKTYPPSVEEGCYCQCIDYWVIQEDDIPTSEDLRMCREGLVPGFHCDIKDMYDRAVDKTPYLEFPDC